MKVFITNFNNLERGFRRLVEWLCESGMNEITVIDNASTYPPLLSAYEGTGFYFKVIRNKENLGPYAFWELGLHKQQAERFIVADPDTVPAMGCPNASRVISHMSHIMSKHNAGKIGLSLRLDYIPSHYKHKDAVINWEQQFWDWPIAEGSTGKIIAYEADIDTTFAMYEPGSEVRNDKPCLRLAPPYSFEHVPWYEDSSAPNAERDYYLAHIRKDWTDWSKR